MRLNPLKPLFLRLRLLRLTDTSLSGLGSVYACEDAFCCQGRYQAQNLLRLLRLTLIESLS